MANSHFIPFNNEPVSTHLETGSYTVPAGKYARIDVIGDYSLFSIDGTTAIESSLVSAEVNNSGSATVFTCAGGRICRVTVSWTTNGGSGSVIIGNSGGTVGSILLATGGVSQEVLLTSGDTVKISAFNGSDHDVLVRGYYIDQVDSSKTFWVPAGTVLVGARYMVALYNIIT